MFLARRVDFYYSAIEILLADFTFLLHKNFLPMLCYFPHWCYWRAFFFIMLAVISLCARNMIGVSEITRYQSYFLHIIIANLHRSIPRFMDFAVFCRQDLSYQCDPSFSSKLWQFEWVVKSYNFIQRDFADCMERLLSNFIFCIST